MPARKPIDAPYKFEVHSDTGRRILLDRLEGFDNGFVVEIRPARHYNTAKQRGLYSGWIADIADETGGDWSGIDKAIRRELLPIVHEVVFGKNCARLTKLEDLNEAQMSTLLDRLTVYNVQNIGANLRDPNEFRKRQKELAG